MSPTSYQTAPPRGEADNLSLHRPAPISLLGQGSADHGTGGRTVRSRPRAGYFEAGAVVDVVDVVDVVEVVVSCCTCSR